MLSACLKAHLDNGGQGSLVPWKGPDQKKNPMKPSIEIEDGLPVLKVYLETYSQIRLLQVISHKISAVFLIFLEQKKMNYQ